MVNQLGAFPALVVPCPLHPVNPPPRPATSNIRHYYAQTLCTMHQTLSCLLCSTQMCLLMAQWCACLPVSFQFPVVSLCAGWLSCVARSLCRTMTDCGSSAPGTCTRTLGAAGSTMQGHHQCPCTRSNVCMAQARFRAINRSWCPVLPLSPMFFSGASWATTPQSTCVRRLWTLRMRVGG